MAGKITSILREYVFGMSLLLIIISLILLVFSILTLSGMTTIFTTLELWNAYILVLSLITFAIGAYYQYSYQKNKRFVIQELETNKRSELCKRHKELRHRSKHLPTKYQKLLKEKEHELNIK